MSLFIWVIIINDPKKYPKKILPESPINTLAGGQLYIKKPRLLNNNNENIITIEENPFEISIVNINAKQAKIVPDAAIPSIPSIKLYKLIIHTRRKQHKIEENQNGSQLNIVSSLTSNQTKTHIDKTS